MSGAKRSISTTIWSDEWFESLDSDYKLLWFYLLSNSRTNMIGVYELPSEKRLSFEVGLSIETIRKGFELFTKDSKALFYDNYVFLVNWTKHQSYNPNMKKSALNSFYELPENVKKLLINSDLNPLEALGNDYRILSKDKVTLSKDSLMLPNIELELELELESETKKKVNSVSEIPFFERDESFSEYYPIVAPRSNHIANGVIKENKSDEFKAWLNVWLHHLHKAGKRLDIYSQELIYRELKDLGYLKMRQKIEFSIKQGYVSLVEPKFIEEKAIPKAQNLDLLMPEDLEDYD